MAFVVRRCTNILFADSFQKSASFYWVDVGIDEHNEWDVQWHWESNIV